MVLYQSFDIAAFSASPKLRAVAGVAAGYSQFTTNTNTGSHLQAFNPIPPSVVPAAENSVS